MIDVKSAVSKAVSFFGLTHDDQKVGDVRLEEVELTDDSPLSWIVTLSFVRPNALAAMHLLSGKEDRCYKQFTVLAENGEVRSMKIPPALHP